MLGRLKTLVVINSSDGQPKSVIVQSIVAEIKRKYSRSKLQLVPDAKGAKMIFTVRQATIGVEIPDDGATGAVPDLALFSYADCDVIICSCNARSALTKTVEGLSSYYDVIWVSNYETNERTRKILNKLFAQSILGLLGEYHPQLRK